MANKKELIGKITDKKLDKVRNRKSEHYNNPYYRLSVEMEEDRIREILVFKEFLKQKTIWEQIEKWQEEDFEKKKFLFKLQRRPGAGQFFRLLDWQEIEPCQE